MNNLKVIKSIEIGSSKTISDLLGEMSQTGFQGKNLAKAYCVLKEMMEDKKTTVLLGYAGSLSTTGQWKMVQWLIENNLVDIIVSTGANISEDIIEAMGFHYYQSTSNINDADLFKLGYNRYYDVLGKESDYLEMTEVIADFILTLDQKKNYSSRRFLYLFGLYLDTKGFDSIVTCAAKKNIPIFCPAIADSPYGDAALIAKRKGFNLIIDSIKDYIEFMSISEHVEETGVFYVGGGVPKDFIQLFAVTADLLYPNGEIPNRKNGLARIGTNETYHPHKYAVQITTDSPQWGGLSGCTFEEAISWGKETDNGKYVQCYCDATIAFPIISQALSENLKGIRKESNFNDLFN